jgi:hypothetical protein
MASPSLLQVSDVTATAYTLPSRTTCSSAAKTTNIYKHPVLVQQVFYPEACITSLLLKEKGDHSLQ